jgi:hypothetical protein
MLHRSPQKPAHGGRRDSASVPVGGGGKKRKMRIRLLRRRLFLAARRHIRSRPPSPQEGATLQLHVHRIGRICRARSCRPVQGRMQIPVLQRAWMQLQRRVAQTGHEVGTGPGRGCGSGSSRGSAVTLGGLPAGGMRSARLQSARLQVRCANWGPGTCAR